jgi:hypothetical protein
MIDDDDEDIEPKTDEAIAPTGDMPTKPKSDTPAGPKLVVDNEEALDEDEKEFRALRQELPGVQGGSAAGIVAISVGKAPNKNAFFRTHPDFHPIIPIVDLEVGMEKQFFAVTPSMVEPLASIGISVTNHTLYLTMTSTGSVRIVPVRCANSDGEQNEWSRTKELGLRAGMKSWVRLYADQENKCYQVFPAPVGRFADAVWPELSHAKVFRLGFRDKGRLIDSTQHPLYLKWTARDHAE